LLKIKFIVLLILAVYLTGCSDAPSPIGVDELGNDLIKVKVYDSQVDNSTQNSNSFKKILPLGASSYCLLGNSLGVKSTLLLQFNVNFDEATLNAIKKDSITLLSARIVLKKAYGIGDTLQSFPVAQVNGYRVTSSWDPLKVKIDSMPSVDYSTDILSAKPAPDSFYYFNVNNAIALQWMKNSYDTINFRNDGLLLRTETATPYIIGFQGYSATGENAPKIELKFRYLSTNKDTTISFRTLSDAHLIEDATPTLATDEIVVKSGTTLQSKLFFDLSSIPANAFINNAEIVLMADTTKQVIGNIGLKSLSLGLIETLTSDSVFTTNSLITATLFYSAGKYSGNLTTVMRQVHANKKNLGFVITTSNPVEGLETIYLKNSNAAAGLKPRLIVTYSKID
jgi:hypothetical protein